MTITLEKVKAGYHGISVLKGVSGEFSKGVLLLGPNGAGKTTLLRAVAGIADVYDGSILVDCIDVSKASGASGLLAVNLPEAYYLLPIPVYSLLHLYASLYGGNFSEALRILRGLGIEERLLKHRRLWQLSAGQAKMVTAAAALASGARNILFDEPFEQLDPARKVRLLEMVREATSHATMVVATHETWLLSRHQVWKVYLMVSGRLFGPISVEEVAELRVVKGRRPEAVLTLRLDGGYVSLARGGEGLELTSLVSLDWLYELLMG
jgi:ABC-type multidrug transport system ATPase subunit